MKKVCMIIPSFSAKGGIASVVSGYKSSILDKEYNIKYISTYCDGRKIKKVLKALSSYAIFIKDIIIRKPDIIHIHSSFGASFFRKLPFIYISSFFQIPIINHIHGSDIDELYTLASDRKKKLVAKSFHKCEKVIVLSSEWRENFSCFIEFDKMKVIENYSILQKNLDKKIEDIRKVLFLGFLSEAKGCYEIPTIVKAVSKVIPNVKFILAGEGTKESLNYIMKQIEVNKVENYILFPGWIRGKEKQELLRSADVFFLPSHNEGMPMSILEAMGFAKPIVSTSVGGIPRIVHQNINGLICEPGDVEGLSSALIEILSNQNLLVSMGLKSYEIVRSEYSLEIHLNKIMELYKEIL